MYVHPLVAFWADDWICDREETAMNAKGNCGAGQRVNLFWPKFERMWSLELGMKARFSSAKLARLCGVSERQLRREFQSHLCYSVKQWLEERRLDAAAARLRQVGLSIGC